MLDWVPIQGWLLILMGLFGYQQVVYVYQHLTHAPSRRDITKPSEDLSWRSDSQLAKSVAILLLLAALAVFIFTPAATEFASSPSFWPLIMSGLASVFLYWLAAGVVKGEIEPIVRGDWGPYSREDQPKKYWASLAWNVMMTVLFVWMAFNMWTNPDWVW